MKIPNIADLVGKTDIYIIDQIMKERYSTGQKLLDAGCAEGRNLKWFYLNNFDIYGIDTDSERLETAKQQYPKLAHNFTTGSIEKLPYEEATFHHILCSAVLHFAQSEKHFFTMFTELIRVLKPEGTLFIRVASNIGLDGNTPYLKETHTNREVTFFITREIITSLLSDFSVELLDPVKTTNVQDKRAMTTLAFQKL